MSISPPTTPAAVRRALLARTEIELPDDRPDRRSGRRHRWLGQVGPPAGTRPGEMLSPALDVYRRPHEGSGIGPAAMQAYLDWEYGLVGQLERDGTHGFRVLTG